MEGHSAALAAPEVGVMATTSWDFVKAARSCDSVVEVAYAAAKLTFDGGAQVRSLREEQGWSQPAVVRCEAGGTTPTLPILERSAIAFDFNLSVQLKTRPFTCLRKQ